MLKKLLTVLLIALLLINDFVAWTELRRTLAWILGDIAPVAAFSMLFLANAVTMAFFFDGLRPGSIRTLHMVAGFLYLTVLLAVYSSAVAHSQTFFPDSVATDAFGMSRPTAIRCAALIVSCAFSVATWAFWSVMGQLISAHTNRSHQVAWRDRAAQHGVPVDNILDRKERSAA